MLLIFQFVFVCSFSDAEYNEELPQSRVSGREGDFPACPQGMLGDAPSGPSGLLTCMEAPALPSTQKGPTAHSPSDCASPCAWESPEGVASREKGLLRALLPTDFSGFSGNPFPRLPPSPSLKQHVFVCLLGYHHEKKGFRL